MDQPAHRERGTRTTLLQPTVNFLIYHLRFLGSGDLDPKQVYFREHTF